MTVNEWMELGYNKVEAIEMVELEKEEKKYEERAHIAYYSKQL